MTTINLQTKSKYQTPAKVNSKQAIAQPLIFKTQNKVNNNHKVNQLKKQPII